MTPETLAEVGENPPVSLPAVAACLALPPPGANGPNRHFLHHPVRHDSHHLPQKALGDNPPIKAMRKWYFEKLDLFIAKQTAQSSGTRQPLCRAPRAVPGPRRRHFALIPRTVAPSDVFNRGIKD